MANNVIGINEAEINNLIAEINDCRSSVNNIFIKLSDYMSETRNYYDCKSAITLRRKYNQLNDDYSVVLNNLSTYARDLQNLKNRYHTNMSDVSMQIKKDAGNAEEYLDF